MNKYQFLKYAVIGLTFTSRTASAVSFLKPELRTFTQYVEPTKQALIHAGNAYWNYELRQQTLPTVTCQETDQE
jgi:hypothetical protein